MKVSLILATVERYAEVERFLEKLDLQTYRNFELILVDQNDGDPLRPLIEKYKNRFPLLHLRSERGLSRARNVGMRRATGDLVAFPDDDCWYAPGVLEQAVGYFRREPAPDVVTGRSVDERGEDAAGSFDPEEGYVDKMNVWNRAISFTIFLKKEVADDIGDFDEEIGVGAGSIYLSGEETDYVLRALKRFKVYYYPEFTVYHANPLRQITPQIIARAYKYGCGFGRVVSKHDYPIAFKLRMLARPLAGTMVYGTVGQFSRSKYYWNSFRGRLRGML